MAEDKLCVFTNFCILKIHYFFQFAILDTWCSFECTILSYFLNRMSDREVEGNTNVHLYASCKRNIRKFLELYISYAQGTSELF